MRLTLKVRASCLWKNSELLILNKPSGWHSVSGKDKSSNNLEDWLKNEFPETKDLPESGLLHRLDFLTSGCIAAARDTLAYEKWKSKFHEGDGVRKTYIALTAKVAPEGVFSFYFSSRYRSSKKVSLSKEGIEKEFGSLRISPHSQKSGLYAWGVELIGAGKRHQIRAAFAHLGAPLLGDSLYGGPSSQSFGLHAWKLECDEFSAIAPIPTEWPTLIEV